MKNKYAYVIFEEAGAKYIYRNNVNCQKGNIVKVPTNNGLFFHEVFVVETVELEDFDLPIYKRDILRIEEIISEKDETFKFDSLGYIKSKIDHILIKEWEFSYQTDWIKVYKSSFGGEISYENDGVLSYSFGDMLAKDYFISYTITTPKNLDIKIYFVETLVSKLFRNQISLEEFNTMIARV